MVSGGGAAIAHTLMRWSADAPTTRCEPAIRIARNDSRGADATHSIAHLCERDGRLVTLAKLAWRCVELLCRLAPVLITLPLLRSSLRARWLRLLVRTLEGCGPVGIKWGQWASTRYDIFEDDLCDALSTLINAAPVHPMAWTRDVVRTELGADISELFDEFSSEPIASASIGQVHTARLRRDYGAHVKGEQVAVKVQHPGLAERLGLDMAILCGAADRLAAVAGERGFSISETVAQFASNFYMQLDFRDEAENLRRFSHHFSGGFWSAIVSFPRPIDPLVSQHVLVETFERGQSVADYLHKAGEAPKVTQWRREGDKWVPVDKAESIESQFRGEGDDFEIRVKVALVGVQSYLKMLMVDNFIHADLHPGNVLVRMEEVGFWGRVQRYLLLGQTGTRVPHIVFLDAGLAAQFGDHIYSNAQNFFESIVRFDGPGFGRAILGLSPSQPRVPSEQAFIDEVSIKMIEMRQEMEAGHGRAGDNIRSFMASVRAHRVSLDPTCMVALMSMMVLEGWQWRLDPSVGIIESIEVLLDRKTSWAGWLMDAASKVQALRTRVSG